MHNNVQQTSFSHCQLLLTTSISSFNYPLSHTTGYTKRSQQLDAHKLAKVFNLFYLMLHTHTYRQSLRAAATKMPINCASQANKNLLHTFEGARALLLRLSSAGFIYLLLHGEFFVALITILTCESKPAKWQDIIQLNSFTCIKLRDNKNALNQRKKEKGPNQKKRGNTQIEQPVLVKGRKRALK